MTVDDVMRVLLKIYKEADMPKEDILNRIRNIISHYELSKKLAEFDGKSAMQSD